VRPLRTIFILGTVKFGVKKTLIASTDHISMMFKPAPETLGKTPSRKKRSKEREDPSPSQKSGTQSASQRGPGTIMLQSPHQSQEGMLLFICFIAKVEQSHTLQDVT